MQTDPYNWPFPRKQDTMYLSTISNQDMPTLSKIFIRSSTFQNHDINGAIPKPLVSEKPHTTNFNLSTFIQPKPIGFRTRNHQSDPLKIDDIEGTRPKASQFRTKRIVDPLCPSYKLASCTQFSLDHGRNFIRDTLQIADINHKKAKFVQHSHMKQQTLGSTCMPRTKHLDAISKLQVKDINKEMKFETKRTTNPLTPHYNWRDNEQMNVNNSYGNIEGTQVRKLHPDKVNRSNNFSLNAKDIEGATSNSYYSRAHFLDKRRQFRNYMETKDIQKANPSSLKKGIETKRQVNPLMPQYQYLGSTQIQKH